MSKLKRTNTYIMPNDGLNQKVTSNLFMNKREGEKSSTLVCQLAPFGFEHFDLDPKIYITRKKVRLKVNEIIYQQKVIKFGCLGF